MFKEYELKLLWPFYLVTLLTSFFSIASPIWFIFLQRNFTFHQIALAISLQSISAILFDVPTGSIADTFGRKLSVVLSIIFQGLLWIALPFIKLPLTLYFLYFLMGISRTLETGADKAWVVDWLKKNKRESLIQDMFIKNLSFSNAGLSLGFFSSSVLLFFLDMKYLLLIQGIGFLFAAIFLLLFTKEIYHKNEHSMENKFYFTMHISSDSFRNFLKDKPLRNLIFATAFSGIALSILCIFEQPFLLELSLPVKYFGVIFSVINLFCIFVPFFSKQFLRIIGKEHHYLAVTTFIQLILLLSLYFIEKPFFMGGILILFIIEMSRHLESPVRSTYFQRLIPSKSRATMGSFQSIIITIFSAIATVAAGYIMDKTGPKNTIIYFSFFLIPAVLFYLKSIRKEKEIIAVTKIKNTPRAL